jgi:hypothetical protein
MRENQKPETRKETSEASPKIDEILKPEKRRSGFWFLISGFWFPVSL